MRNMKNSVKPAGRNFALHVPEEQKAVMRMLAEESDMNLTQYVEAVIAEAVRNRDTFSLSPVKKKAKN